MGARMNKKEYPIVEVMWVDAEEKGEVGWNDIKEMIKYAKRPCPTMRTVGYEIFKGPDHISLLSTVGPDECSTVEKIPISFIKNITYLKELPGKSQGTTTTKTATRK